MVEWREFWTVRRNGEHHGGYEEKRNWDARGARGTCLLLHRRLWHSNVGAARPAPARAADGGGRCARDAAALHRGRLAPDDAALGCTRHAARMPPRRHDGGGSHCGNSSACLMRGRTFACRADRTYLRCGDGLHRRRGQHRRRTGGKGHRTAHHERNARLLEPRRLCRCGTLRRMGRTARSHAISVDGDCGGAHPPPDGSVRTPFDSVRRGHAASLSLSA